MRPAFNWRLRTRTLALGPRTLVMGVLNVTPDSFSEQGRFFAPDRAVNRALQMLDEGADIVDVGGESTRPGARVSPQPAPAAQAQEQSGKPAVTAEQEMERVLPVIQAIRRERPQAVISVDTYKSAVARAAIEAGAEIVNDVSALRWDPGMAGVVAELRCGAVLMHMRGRPEEWRNLPAVPDMVSLVARELEEWSRNALAAGVARESLVLDPGFGFGKNFEQNYPLLEHLDELHRLGYPLLAGTSRKSFVGRAMARGGTAPAPEDRLYGSLAAMVITIVKGAHLVRVHDVRPAVEAAAVTDAILMSG